MVVVWGANEVLRREVIRTARSLDAMGLAIAVVYGPSLDAPPSDTMVRIQYYAKEVDPFGRTFAVGLDNRDTIEGALTETCQRIQQAAFPESMPQH